MMRKLLFIIIFCWQICSAQNRIAEDYYIDAFNEISAMLSKPDSLSIKRAVFLAEWAYYEGNLDYQADFCDEIDRITKFVNLFYKANGLDRYKTGKQMALNEYFFKPYSGNHYKPYTYNYDKFLADTNDRDVTAMFISVVLKTHKGQCHSLPWLYKILAKEIGADVHIAHAPRHCYIMYKDEDNLTPEPWINLELPSRQMVPSFWTKMDFEICDSALIAGTYMTPLTDTETVACQLADLAYGYYKKFNRCDDFTLFCATRSLQHYPMNPMAWTIRGHSLENALRNHLKRNRNRWDRQARYLNRLIDETARMYHKTYVTEETPEVRKRRIQQIIELQKQTENKHAPK